ncbi:GroS Co-chaperonin GroES (HSP10) [uncultured Caudovirales phage]|uniref:GroS Co-chaperonin GroES (HSP10) n=1 Tax=uncultured Caudovirales phage TaxID=2100421 RepID=A0A6J7WG12_9CAUD|nr:GroS Co-chaperonin GroES (HSP10) [uncultured Caudovirales phage]
MTKLKAVGTRVLLTKNQEEEKSVSGIILTKTQAQNPRATIIDIGSQALEKNPVLKPGQLAAVEWSQTAEVKHNNTTYYIADVGSIYAVEV